MPDLPCQCSHGHAYSRTECEEYGCICPRDGLPIVCEAESGPKKGKSADRPPGSARRRKPG